MSSDKASHNSSAQQGTRSADRLVESLTRAVAQHRAGNLDDAERLYRSILASAPAHPQALEMLGVAAAQRGMTEQAHELMSRAWQLHPQSAEAYLRHAEVVKALQLFEQAVACYDQALSVRGNDCVAWNERGVALRAIQRYGPALASFDRALAIAADFAVAHYNRGLVLQDLNRHEEAVASYDVALALEPRFVQALNNRGRALCDLRRFDEAIASWDRALVIKPDFAEAISNRAAVLRQFPHAGSPVAPSATDRGRGRPDDSPAFLARCEEAVTVKPDFAAGWSNRGIALREVGRREEAVASFERALGIDPKLTDALVNRAITLKELQRHPEALTDCDRAVALDPGRADAHNTRGTVLSVLHRHLEALECYERALELRPDFAEAHNNRAAALVAIGRYDLAIASCDQALACNPRFAEALDNRGVALAALYRHGEAMASFDAALAIRPEFAEALRNRGSTLSHLGRHAEACDDFSQALVYKPDLDFVAGSLVHSRLHCCAWRGLDADLLAVADGVRRGLSSIEPFQFLQVSDSPGEQLQCARKFGSERYPPAATPLWDGERYRHERIRVAYLSSDFHEHATAHLAVELFERHDRDRFDVCAVSFGPDDGSAMRSRLRGAFEHFIDVRNVSDGEVAAILREREIDIAIDLKGYTAGARPGIFALRPAPLQVNYLGYPGTLGAGWSDYIIADAVVIPDDAAAFFSEKVVHLPDAYQPNGSDRRLPARTLTRIEAGLPESGFVFCCFNSCYKVTPAMFAVWMRLLKAVEGSVLWLLEGNAIALANLRREAASGGVAPERLIFAPRRAHQEHLERHRLADLFLDTLPVNAHTTASDALRMGLPVLTCLGNAFAGRVAASLLRTAGLPEFVTHSPEELEAKALELARHPSRLVSARTTLAREDNRLFDADLYRRHLETALVTMWRRWQQGEAPCAFAVAPIVRGSGHSGAIA